MASELRNAGIKTLGVSLEVFEHSLKKGIAYGEESAFGSAIIEFTTIIDLFPQLVELTKNLNLPRETALEATLLIVDFAFKAYSGRSAAYTQIGEKEKAQADMIMAEKIKNAVPSQSKNNNLSNSNYTPPDEIIIPQSNQFTNSNNRNASKDFKYSRIGSNKIKIEKYIGSETFVNIPSHIDNLPVTLIEAEAFKECKSLSSIQIPSSVTTIGDRAFSKVCLH